MGRLNAKDAIAKIQTAGALLIYPVDNAREPPSLWKAFFPRTPMRWEWDEAGDSRVAELWHLREQLAKSRKVIYAKWYRGRATVFSPEVFKALLCRLNRGAAPLSREARALLELLEDNSPLSTKVLKRLSGLTGKANERVYEKAMRELWQRLLIVGFGEVDDGAFPSLAVGATRLLFEDLWLEAAAVSPLEAEAVLNQRLPERSAFRAQLRKYEARL